MCVYIYTITIECNEKLIDRLNDWLVKSHTSKTF